MGNPSSVAYIRRKIRTEIIDQESNSTFLDKYYEEIKKFREKNPRSQKILPLKLDEVKENSLASYYIKAFKLEKIYSRWVPIKGREFHSKFRKQISNHNTALISFVNYKKESSCCEIKIQQVFAQYMDNNVNIPVIDSSTIEHNGIKYEYLDEAYEDVKNSIETTQVT